MYINKVPGMAECPFDQTATPSTVRSVVPLAVPLISRTISSTPLPCLQPVMTRPSAIFFSGWISFSLRFPLSPLRLLLLRSPLLLIPVLPPLHQEAVTSTPASLLWKASTKTRCIVLIPSLIPWSVSSATARRQKCSWARSRPSSRPSSRS